MAKPRLEEMRIRPGKGGGHHVIHSFAPAAKLAKGALSGGMMMGRPPDQEFNFSPKDGGNLMKHIASTLALKGMPSSAPAPGGAPSSPDEESAAD